MRQATLGTRQVTLYPRPNNLSGPIDLAGARELAELIGPPETIWPTDYGYGEGYREGYTEGYTEPQPEPEPARRGAKHRGTHRKDRRGGRTASQGNGRSGGQDGRRRTDGAAYGRAGVAVLAVTGVLAGGGIAGTAYLASSGHGQSAVTGAMTLHATAVASLAGAENGADGAGSALPAPSQAAPPNSATVPRVSRSKKARSATSPSPAQSAAPSPAPTYSSPSPTASQPPSPSPTPTAPTGGAASCTDPVFTTSTKYGTYTELPYFVANDMWNVGSSNASQTLDVCSSSEWSVTASVSGGGNSVKTYPNSQRDFDSTPKISSLSSVTSTFADSWPNSGTYEDAYDIWLNGVANPGGGSDEVMIWTHNHGQIPGGSPQATVTFDGRSYTVWKGTGNYFAFVANSSFDSGDLNLLEFFQYLISKGWIPSDSTLSQVDYGVEIVATNGPETFSFSDFSVSTS